MATDAFLYEVRCACCHRLLGITESQKWGVYCDTFCVSDIPIVEQEGRDAIIEALARDTDIPASHIAKKFGFSRQRIYQLLNFRDLKKALNQ